MRAIALTAAALFITLAPGLASAAISCSDLPKAQDYLSHLGPGPNTRAAQAHLDAAKAATSDGQCVAELRRVDYYERRSAAADRHMSRHHRRMACADAMHQDRPGGTDYHGPAVPGCRPVP